MTQTYLDAASGSIATSGNSGWYAVTLTAGTQYIIDAGNGTLSDPAVTLYDSAGDPLVSGTAGAGPNSESELSYTPTVSGTYLIGASSVGSSTGSYYVQLSTVPEDYAGSTATNGTLSTASVASGTISAIDQADWFKTTLTAGEAYLFTLGSGTLSNATLTFYTSNGALIPTNNTPGFASSIFEPTTSGPYFVGVSNGGNGGTGTFLVSESVITATPAIFGTINTSGALTVGGAAVTGDLTIGGQSAWYKVTLAADTLTVFDVVGQTLNLPTVALYDSNGAILVPQTINGGPGTSDSRISYMSASGGTYYVEASGLLDATGTFTVAATTVATDYFNNPNTTGTVAVGGLAYGTISATGQTDWFAVTLTAGTTYVFDVKADTLGAASVALYDSASTLRASGTGSATAGTAETSFDPTVSGTYYVAAGGQGSDTGTFTVAVKTEATPSAAGNDTTSASVAVGHSASGSLASSGESAWYAVTLTAGTLYVFDASGSGSSPLADPKVVLSNAAGQQLEVGTAGGPIVTSGGGGAQTIYDPTTSGTYFVSVESQSSDTGSYTVSVATATPGTLQALAAPVVATQTAEQFATAGQAFSIALPADTFTDPNGLSLTDSATLAGNQALPAWLTFNAATDTFSGTAPSTGQTLTVDVTATDVAGLATTESFALQVTSAFTVTTEQEVATFVSQENIYNNAGVVTNYSAIGTAQPGTNLGVITPPAGDNAAIGFYSATFTGSGADAVILDGPRANYAISVTENGYTTITDIGVGDPTYNETVHISGESYIIFDGAQININDSPSSAEFFTLPNKTPAQIVLDYYPGDIYYILPLASAQLAQFYNSLEPWEPQPALSGLEYWETQLAAVAPADRGAELESIAQSFINASTVFNDPGTTHASHVAYVQVLYQDILGLTLNAENSGVLYWAGQMDSGILNAPQTLISFTNAEANEATINAVSGATAGSGEGWLIDYASTGGYADPVPTGQTTLQLAGQAFLTQAQTLPSVFYDLSLVDPNSVDAASASKNGVTLFDGGITVAASAAQSTIALSADFTQATIAGANNSILDGVGDDAITVTGSGNYIFMGNATKDTLNLANGINTLVLGFTPGKGSVLDVSGVVNETPLVTVLDGTQNHVSGSSLNFGTAQSSTAIFIYIGTIASGPYADVEAAAAANLVYTVADTNGSATTGALGEHVMFIGTDAGGDTEIWAFRAPLSSYTIPGGQTVQVPISGADTLNAGTIQATELTQVATLVGVQANTLTAADLA